MDSRCNKSCTEENSTKVFELIITNPCSEPSEPVDISCVIKDITSTTNALDTAVGKDVSTDSEPIVIDDIDNEDSTTTEENLAQEDIIKNFEAITETRNNVNKSVVKITFDCNDNQKESMESVTILGETTKGDLNQTKLSSGQLRTRNVVHNDNLTADGYIDLYEAELENALNANKRDTRKIVLDKPPQNAVDIDTGKCTQVEKAVCLENIAKKDDPTTSIDLDFYEAESKNVVALHGNKEKSDVIVLDNKTSSESIILQQNKEIKTSGKEYPPIDLVAEEDLITKHVISEDYADEFKENSLLAELVQKCLSMERNGGMSRVINRTLLNIYKSVDENYKKSVALRKVLTKTIMKLHMEPELKFSHIKCLCDHLKLHMVKKRVPFVTLEKRNTGDQSTSTIPSKKRRLETIDLENYSVKTTAPRKPKEYPSIEIEDSSSSIEEVNTVIMADKEKVKKKKIRKKKKKKQKGGLARSFIPTLVRNPFCTLPDQSLKEIPTSNETERLKVKPIRPVSTHIEPTHKSRLQSLPSANTPIVDSIEEQINDQPLLTPVLMKPVPLDSGNSDQLDDDDWKKSEIEKIEKHIAFLRERIEGLEVMEVQVDDESSPYIVSEQLQSLLVKQYKKLCELTGTRDKKQHKVRLQVLPGHPEAPVRYLQEFLNNNIDEEGDPPFPDLYDVIQCVSKANVESHLNWGQAQIMKEARSLFIQFGQTMQKRRQKREWKDLMSRVKEEVNDPAEEDPELMMKLNRNSWLAKQKENALLERFASLEETGLSVRMANELSVRIENGGADPETESSDDENTNPRVPYSSVLTYGRQNNVASSVSVTNGNIGIPATYDSTNNQEVVGSTITLSNGHIEIAPTYDMQKSSIVLPNGTPLTPFQLSSNNAFGVNSSQNATLNTFVVNDIQNVTNPANRISQNPNNAFGVNSTQSATLNTFVVNDIQNVTSPENRISQNPNNAFGVNSTQNATLNTFVVNDNHNVTSSQNRVANNQCNDLYSLTFQNFTLKLAAASKAGKCNLCASVQSNTCFHNKSVSKVNNRNVSTAVRNVSAINNNVAPVNNSNLTAVNNSNLTTVNNSNVTTVNSIVGTDTSDEVQSKADLEIATNLAKTIMELVQKDVALRTNNGKKNPIEIARSTDLTKSTYVKVKEETAEKNHESVCDIFTHKTKPTNKITFNENTEVKEMRKSIETKTDDIIVSNQGKVETSIEIETKDVPIEDIVKPEPLDIRRMLTELADEINVPNQGEVETSSEIETKDVPIEDIVKPEPLDIPRMLAELGDDFTTEVFDIEDPFLVIEISDSSESEDEVT